jgi:signal transduction histidine kinase
VVEAGKSYDSVEDALDAFTTVLVIGGLLAFLLSVGGAYLLARAALSPVEAVVSSAREMTEGDLSQRLPVAHPKDEIGRLTTTINALLARLEAAFARREEALARQRRFAADASHELRTPLTSIGDRRPRPRGHRRRGGTDSK